MDHREQKRQERAYKIWEDEGRIDGGHLDHWQRVEDEHEEKISDEVVDDEQEENPENGGPTSNKPGRLYGTLVPQVKPKK